MIRKGPILAKTARMGHPNSKSKPKFKIETQIQNRNPNSKSKPDFKG
jgi:hypothetical protein